MTGGAGLVGSRLSARLVAQGHHVIVLDNFSSGSRTGIKDLARNKLFALLEADVRESDSVRSVTKGSDAVVHLAALVDVEGSFRSPRLTREVNVGGTEVVVEACRAGGVKRLVFASSSAVYGDAGDGAITEEAKLAPLSPYAESKIAGESLCKGFSGASRSAVSLRYFNVYGRLSSRPAGAVVERFISRIRSGRPPIIYGDGRQTRDFVHVDDVAEATSSAIFRTRAEGPVNVGSGKTTRIDALAKMLLKLLSRPDLLTLNLAERRGDIRHSLADLRKARRTLKYAPRVSLREGLGRTLFE